MPIVYLHEVKVVREQISGDRLETALNSRPPRQLMSEKEVSARSQVKIGKKFIAKVRKPKVRARHYYVKLYPPRPRRAPIPFRRQTGRPGRERIRFRGSGRWSVPSPVRKALTLSAALTS